MARHKGSNSLPNSKKSQNGSALYILHEPTTGPHPRDVEKLLIQLNRLVDTGNTVIFVEHDMQVIAQSDWIIDIGLGASDLGGKILYSGPAKDLTKVKESNGTFSSTIFIFDWNLAVVNWKLKLLNTT